MRFKQILFSTLLFISISSITYAQVFLEDGKVKLSVSPGENVTGKLILHNTSDENVNMKVYWEDFVYKPPYDGSKDFLPRGTGSYSAANWVNISTKTLMFGPFAKRTISYSINVPDDIRQGHYGVLFFENAEKQIDSTRGIHIVTRVGCLFFIEPKEKNKKVDLKGFEFTGKELTASFTNLGNVILIPDGTFYVIDQDGMVFDRGEISKIYLPPDKSADYGLTLNRDLDPGTYTLVMTVTLEDDDIFVKEIDFEKNYSSGFNIIAIRD